MNMKEFFRLSKLKIIVLILTFLFVFFVKIPALFSPCTWRACPDYLGADIVSLYPSFYRPAGCGYGIGYICWEASWSMSMLDIVVWVLLVVIIFFIINKLRNKSTSQT